MALDTYANLQTAIITWLFRTGDTPFADSVPDFITLAESRFNRELRTSDMEATATITLTSGTGALPADYLEYREVKTIADTPVVLGMVEPNYGDQFYATGTSETPQYFSIIGSKIHTFPPSSNNLTLRYYKKITALSNDDTSNWLLDKAPELYLFASLVEGAQFMMEDERMAAFEFRYEHAKQALINQDIHARYGKAAVKVRWFTP